MPADAGKKHELLLAFDSRPITLAWLRLLIERRKSEVRVLVATGDAASDKKSVLEVFQPGSNAKGVIGLCSDSLSEGVNLQQATFTCRHPEKTHRRRVDVRASSRAGVCAISRHGIAGSADYCLYSWGHMKRIGFAPASM